MEATIIKSTIYNQLDIERKTFQEQHGDHSKMIKVFSEKTKQTIQGFGSSFTEGAGVVYNSMSDKSKKELLELYFSENGNQYNLARMPVQSSDFSIGNYAYVNNETDLKKGNFDFSRDEKNIIPFIKDALVLNPTIIFMSSPWSPPAFMKTNNDMNKGGYLKEEYQEGWAQIITAYVKNYQEQGIAVKKISIQNEPIAVKQWDSCLYANDSERSFAVDVLKPCLQAAGFEEIELYIWDHDKDGLIDWCEKSFAEPHFRNNIAGVGFHWYTGDHFEQIEYLRDSYPEKDLLFTEGCVPFEGFEKEVQEKHGSVYIHDLIGDLKAGTTGYIDWNILLDITGGPNHMGNTCEAPILYNQKTDSLQINYSYYCIAHFSRYVAKGAKVIYSSSYDALIEQVAFINPDGTKVLVAYNNSTSNKNFCLVDKDEEIQIKLTAKEIVTVKW